jgi:Dullard-like phosphatase family protein
MSDAASTAMTHRTGKQVTINLESVILLENKLFRIFNTIKTIKLITTPNPTQTLANTYAA